MALQKLRVNCLIFVLVRRQVRRVETKSEYESNKPLQGTIRARGKETDRPEREILQTVLRRFEDTSNFASSGLCRFCVSISGETNSEMYP